MRQLHVALGFVVTLAGCSDPGPTCPMDGDGFANCDSFEVMLDEAGMPSMAILPLCSGDAWEFRCLDGSFESRTAENPRCTDGRPSCSRRLGTPMCYSVPCDGEWHRNPAFE